MESISKNLNLSLQELLSVLFPGVAGLFFLHQIPMLRDAMHRLLFERSDWETGIIYFGIVYFLGYVIYVASSPLDAWYDDIKRKALRLDKPENKGKKLQLISEEEAKKIHFFYRKLFPHLRDTHNLIVKVVAFKNRDIGTDLDGNRHQIIDAYQYSFRRLMAEQTDMFAEVERYYATARFFRGMTVVLFFGTFIWLICASNKLWAIGLFGLTIISLFVFFNRWRKANHVAFKNIIILEGIKKQKQKQEKNQ